jgi:hypothetical protein
MKCQDLTWYQASGAYFIQPSTHTRKGERMKSSCLRNGGQASKVIVYGVMLVMVIWLSAPQSAVGQTQKKMIEQYWIEGYGNNALQSFSTGVYGFKRQLLAKAQPDECFQGVGNPDNLNDPRLGFYGNYPGDLSEEQKTECLALTINKFLTLDGYAQPKTNQAYVWGLTKFGHNLWFGTIPNTHCLVISGFLGQTGSSLNHSWVCEGGSKDFRPPRAFYYDIAKKKLIEATQKILDKGNFDSMLLKSTIGLRSAGSARKVAFLGGIASGSGVNIFAFDAQTGEYLGANNYPEYNNIRQWLSVGDELYVGVAKLEGGGEILRWTGKRSKKPGTDLFAFEKVGEIGGDPAYLAYHEGRLFVSTWPALQREQMSIYMSPTLGSDGKLTSVDSAGWKSVWKISEYEPELSVVLTTGGGALMSYGGYLYWGTMHVPGLSLLAWSQMNPQASEEDRQVAVLGTYRPISLFRGKGFGSPSRKVELLYGNYNLPKYTPTEGWQIKPNNMSQTSKYGLAGINNFFNNYTWWMEVFQGQLFVGTMDFLYLGGAEIGGKYEFPEKVVTVARKFYGADLWRFTSSDRRAVPVSLNGVGNFSNYGIRTMVATEDALYIGTANPMNLMTDPTDDKPEGGWELIKLSK